MSPPHDPLLALFQRADGPVHLGDQGSRTVQVFAADRTFVREIGAGATRPAERERPGAAEENTFIRVSWPLYPTDLVAARMPAPARETRKRRLRLEARGR